MLSLAKATVPFPVCTPRVVMQLRGCISFLDIGAQGSDLVVWYIRETLDLKADRISFYIFSECAPLLEEQYDIDDLAYWRTVQIRLPQLKSGDIVDRQSVVHVFVDRAWDHMMQIENVKERARQVKPILGPARKI